MTGSGFSSSASGQASSFRGLELRVDELEASESRYQRLLNNIPAAVLQVDASGMAEVFRNLRRSGLKDLAPYMRTDPDLVDFANREVVIKDVNEAAIKMFGARNRRELLRSVGFLFEVTPEAAANVMAARFDGRSNHTQKMKVRRLDGEIIEVVLMVSYPQLERANDRTVLMLADITEHARIERELKKMEAEFAQYARLSVLAELSGAIVHEVRQPLSVIATDAGAAMRWLSRDDFDRDKIRQLASRISENAHRANEVIRRVKDMAAKSQPARSHCEFNQLVRESIEFVRREAERKKIAIHEDLSAEPLSVTADGIQMQQVVVNLLLNAIQSIDQAGSGVRRVGVRTACREGRAVLMIEDSGSGIPEHIQSEIFDSFFTTKRDGMGMGLSICRSIVEAHSGRISFDRSRGEGAEFTVTIPLFSSFAEPVAALLAPYTDLVDQLGDEKC